MKITDLDLDTVKNYLKVDFDDDDVFISTAILAAQSYIQSYLNRSFDEFEVIPEEFTIAALSLISQWYERREIQANKNDRGELLYSFSGLLDLHRNWNAGEEA